MIRWLKRHTSMRGRLSMILILLLVLPQFAVGYVFTRAMETRHDEVRVAQGEGAKAALGLRLEETLAAFSNGLQSALTDTALRLSRTRVATGDALARAFKDLPEARRPSYLGLWRASDGFDPPLASSQAERLEAWAHKGRPFAGHAVLPALDGTPADELFQLVLEPLSGGSVAVALFGLDNHEGGLVEAMPLGDPVLHGVTARDIPVAVVDAGHDSIVIDPDICATFWKRVEHPDADGGTEGTWIDADTGFSAAPLLGFAGKPVGLAFVQASVGDGYADRVAAGGTTEIGAGEIYNILGWIVLAGVILAVGLGAVAPQWIWSDIRDSTDRIFGSVARLRELVGRNGRALDEQLTAVTNLTSSVDALADASTSIRDTTQQMSQSAEQSARVSQSGNRSAETAQRAVLDVRDQVGEISDLMDQLGHRCQEIDGILEFINQISEGTKKLSVNATISADDPGAAGKQLSYVAGEIRELAEQALDSTQDIEQRIKEIQRSSTRTMAATKSGRKEVQRCLESFEELEEAFARILRWVDETTQFAHGIDVSTATQSKALDSVSGSVTALERRAAENESNFRDIEDAIDELASLGEHMMETWKVG